MKKYFNNSFEWSKNGIDHIGLPRPFFTISKDFAKLFNFKMPKKVPVPWQSFPGVYAEQIKGFFSIILTNESQVYNNNLCAYCGIKILNDENCIRWTNSQGKPSEEGPAVASDSHPFHFECMKQARIFCPHMKTQTDDTFEVGTFESLRKNADAHINKYKNTPPN